MSTASASASATEKKQKRGVTLASKLNKVMYSTFSNYMLGSKSQNVGTLAQAISDAGAMTPEEAQELLREFVESSFGKTHRTTGFMLWSNENRKKVMKDLDTKKMGEVASELGKRWKQVSEKEKKKWNEKAKVLNSENSTRDFSPTSKPVVGTDSEDDE